MSITTVSPVYDLGTRADYLEFGVGAKKKGHKAAGTDRLAPGFYCDAPSIAQFIETGNRLAEQNGRRVKAHSYIVSFHPDELDVNDPLDLQRAGDLAFLLAKKMRPNSPAMVVVHDDGQGGCAHAHITILNHDAVTGKAPRDYRVHWQVKRANDALMQEEGMQVTTPAPVSTPGSYWANKRGDMAAFDQQLGDAIEQAGIDTSAVDLPTFIAACRARGVEVITTEHKVKHDGYRSKTAGETATGITYKMRDESTPGKNPRVRRRKASALSPEFTAEGLDKVFTKKQEMKEQKHGNHGDPQSAAPRPEQRAATDFGDVEFVARSTRRDREEPAGDRELVQLGGAELHQHMGGAGADAAVDAAAEQLQRLRERLARQDADNTRDDYERDAGTAGQLQSRQAARRVHLAGRGRVRPRTDAEHFGQDHSVGNDELEIG
ncbi:relaxase/mobilization nuclease domain-containing protein [Arthrobacter sp. YD4]|uniref:relaxase/mobilization nuclease domain-containing protein n=1 Tax=Arthrobacter sp. YD4 TaxID=3058043 RepID=UPI0025B4DD15|nr:relaxase/mobilization nuclease domain-containing protein [Arthrobacter sp. YD4]MDN3935693.1 relaxase/mobilization nuclease domain-containing protein [Arthrobacter sp. YD4]